ncbi:hypothetical protein FJ250_00620 [bacterium]|nr:hypothetical protein [bacterium]
MSAMGLDRRLLMPRPGRLAVRLALGVAMPLVVVVVTIARGGSAALVWFGVLFGVAQVSLAVTLTHKELIAAAPSYFQPGLRRRLVLAHVTWALGLGVAAALVVALVPGAGALRALSQLGAAVSLHALLALLALRLSWGYQLPLWSWYAWMPLRAVDALAAAGRFEALQAAAWAWLAAGALLLALLARTLARPGLHRRLHGTLALSLEDWLRPQRMQAYKRECRRRFTHARGAAWRGRLLGAQLRRAARARAAGDVVAAQRRRLLGLGLLATTSERVWVLPIIAAGMLAFAIFGGYFDAAQQRDRLDGWFGGLAYQAATWPLWSLGAYVFAATADVSRRTGLRAECGLLARLALLALAASLATALGLALLAAVLPPITRDGRVLEFVAARPHGTWLVPLLAPLAWLALALRPTPHASWTGIVAGPLFVLGHGLLTMVPYRQSVPLLVAASLLALLVAYRLRRRWWERADLGH